MNKDVHYYTNRNGVQLHEYLENTDATGFAYFALYNAVKYQVRAGKKPNTPRSHDIMKRDHYVAEVALLSNKMFADVLETVIKVADDFKHYEF